MAVYSSIREIPVSTMDTLTSTTTCIQVSDTPNIITTGVRSPHFIEVHIIVVNHGLLHKGDKRKCLLRADYQGRPDGETEQQEIEGRIHDH